MSSASPLPADLGAIPRGEAFASPTRFELGVGLRRRLLAYCEATGASQAWTWRAALACFLEAEGFGEAPTPEAAP